MALQLIAQAKIVGSELAGSCAAAVMRPVRSARLNAKDPSAYALHPSWTTRHCLAAPT